MAQGATYLPTCMAYEQVTPPQKENLAATLPEFSANGNRILFRSLAALGGTPGIYNSLGDFYLSARGSSGWGNIVPLAPPAEFINSFSAKSLALTPTLESWLLLASPTQKANELNQRQVFQGALDGSWKVRSPLLSAPGLSPVTLPLPEAASADLSWVFVMPESKSTTYLAGDPTPEGSQTAPAAPNAYAFGPSSTEPMLLARDSGGKVWGGSCGAWIGGSAASAGSSGHPPYGSLGQGAVSADGEQVFFTTRPNQPQPLAWELGKPTCVTGGTVNTASGSNTLTAVVSARGTGVLNSGEKLVTGVTATSGTFLPGQAISGTGVAPGTTIATVEKEKIELSIAATASGTQTVSAGAQPFAVGQAISGTGIPSGATIVAVSGQTLTISAPATATASGVSVSAINPLRIMERRETAIGPEIEELVPGGPAAGNDLYQGASLEGNRIYFTTTRQLASTDKDTGTECSKTIGSSQGCDLYLLDTSRPASEQLTQVSAGSPTDPTPGEGAKILGSPLAISGDGSRVYFVAQGVLTREPREGLSGHCLAELSSAEQLVEETTLELGKCRPKQGALNLYTWDADTEHTAFIGDLDSSCANEAGPRGVSPNNESDCTSLFALEGNYWNNAMAVPMLGNNPEDLAVGGNGHILAFKSSSPLTADDPDGHYSDVFRYDADTESLLLVSKAAPGGSETPADNVSRVEKAEIKPPLPDFGELQRWVSEDGDVIAFGTETPLTPGDTDGLENPFLWQLRGGEEALTRLPATGSPFTTEKGPGHPHGVKVANLLPTVSLDGNEVAFESSQSLVSSDRDTAGDIYVARVNGGFPGAEPPSVACGGEACLGPPATASQNPAPPSSILAGRGNVKRNHHNKKKHRRRHTHHHHRGNGTRAPHRHGSTR